VYLRHRGATLIRYFSSVLVCLFLLGTIPGRATATAITFDCLALGDKTSGPAGEATFNAAGALYIASPEAFGTSQLTSDYLILINAVPMIGGMISSNASNPYCHSCDYGVVKRLEAAGQVDGAVTTSCSRGKLMRLFFWKWKLSLLRSGFARLGALGEEPVAVGDEQHVALRPWISHYARDLKRFAFKLSPACSPARECIDMPADPIGQRLAPACLGMRRAPRRRRARAAPRPSPDQRRVLHRPPSRRTVSLRPDASGASSATVAYASQQIARRTACSCSRLIARRVPCRSSANVTPRHFSSRWIAGQSPAGRLLALSAATGNSRRSSSVSTATHLAGSRRLRQSRMRPRTPK
jgi:hypothetical protein